MAKPPSAQSQAEGSESLANGVHGPNLTGPTPGPGQSVIRELNAEHLAGPQSLKLVAQAVDRPAITPPRFPLDVAAERYAQLAQNDSNVLRAVRTGDLPQAIVTLLQENFQLRQEIESSRSDFDELRSMNVALQEEADARLAVADDQRLELLEQLERMRNESAEREAQIERMRNDGENDLELIRQQYDALELETVELRAQLAKR